jgi:hypothetical protein
MVPEIGISSVLFQSAITPEKLMSTYSPTSPKNVTLDVPINSDSKVVPSKFSSKKSK